MLEYEIDLKGRSVETARTTIRASGLIRYPFQIIFKQNKYYIRLENNVVKLDLTVEEFDRLNLDYRVYLSNFSKETLPDIHVLLESLDA